MKKIVMIAGLLTGFAANAQAQTTVDSGSASRANSTLIQQNIIPGTSNVGNPVGSGVGYINQNNTGTVWTLGIAPSMSATQYDACTKYFSVSAIAGGINVPLEIDMCWKMRQMEAMAKFPPGSSQYNLGCADSGWLQNDWDSGVFGCVANRAKLRKQNPNDPRGQQVALIPVIANGMQTGSVLGQPIPPTVVPVPVQPVAQVPTRMADAAALNVSPAEACYAADGTVNGRIVNGSCQ